MSGASSSSTFSNCPERAWTILAIRWAVWFQVLAGLNELMWRHITDSVVPQSARWFAGLELSEAFWANAKLGVIVLTLAFGAAQLPLIFRHQPKTDGSANA